MGQCEDVEELRGGPGSLGAADSSHVTGVLLKMQRKQENLMTWREAKLTKGKNSSSRRTGCIC